MFFSINRHVNLMRKQNVGFELQVPELSTLRADFVGFCGFFQ